MKIAAALLCLCLLLAISASLAPNQEVSARSIERLDPLLATSQIISELHGFENSDEWHRSFGRRFAEGSIYDRKQIERVAEVFISRGVIEKIEFKDTPSNPGALRVEVRFKPSGASMLKPGPVFPLSAVVFTLTTNVAPRIMSIHLDGC